MIIVAENDKGTRYDKEKIEGELALPAKSLFLQGEDVSGLHSERGC
jgi:hypothetical protein